MANISKNSEKVDMYKLVMEAMEKRIPHILADFRSEIDLKEFGNIIRSSELTLEVKKEVLEKLQKMHDALPESKDTAQAKKYLWGLIQELSEK